MKNAAQDPTQVFGQEVVDSDGHQLGKVENVWVDDATNELEFVAVKTGFIFGKSHIIPVADAQFADNRVTVPFGHDQIKGAPSFGADEELSPAQEQEIYAYYGLRRSEAASPTGLPTDAGADGATNYGTTGRDTTGFAAEGDNADQAGVTLSKEELQVGTREVESGRARLRKVVHTEHREVPVDLRREEVIVERVDASDASVPGNAFSEDVVEVPLMREEAVVSKEAHVTGGVRLNKEVQTETRTVGGDVRREDVEVDGDVDANTIKQRP